eukprot:TRINITY_DN4394_c0_g1_i5.p1 TRINITY_DN4394_c0_g1~~TRINITY_DN4394_c0_g1_i5.p1  ORF type:complete len:559 (-),score=119.31 TRINITY_DN4394_c0_g1_i5:45-1721(-)
MEQEESFSVVVYDNLLYPTPPRKFSIDVERNSTFVDLRHKMHQLTGLEDRNSCFTVLSKTIADETQSLSPKMVIHRTKIKSRSSTELGKSLSDLEPISEEKEPIGEQNTIAIPLMPELKDRTNPIKITPSTSSEEVQLRPTKSKITSLQPKIQKTVLFCGRLIDGISNQTRKDAVVVIVNDKIVEIGGQELISMVMKDDTTVDLSTSTVLPGLIDCHAHILIRAQDYQYDHLKQSSAFKALYGLKTVQEMLNCGWTTIRVAGDADVYYAHLDIKKAIDQGLFVGPRITGAGHYLSITGGGGDINSLAPENSCHFHPDGKIVDGPEDMRKAVREEIKFGSQWIKLLVTGAFMSANDDPRNVHMSFEEVKMAVDEANRFGRHVMAHAHSAEGILLAAKAGVRSVEHGSFINDEGISVMKRKGIYLVPTLYIGEHFYGMKAEGPLEKMISLTNNLNEESLNCVRNAVKKGVKICVGTDYVGWEVEKNAKEFKCLMGVGLSAMDAIKAGTSVAAELLLMNDKIGSIEKGKYADIIAVRNNPLTDISELERVKFVMVLSLIHI